VPEISHANNTKSSEKHGLPARNIIGNALLGATSQKQEDYIKQEVKIF